MSARTKPRATYRTELQHGYVWHVIECPAAKTRIGVPKSLPLVRPGALVEGVIYRHEEECQACSVNRVRKRHGDAEFRKQFEAAWAGIEHDAQRRYAWMRRN